MAFWHFSAFHGSFSIGNKYPSICQHFAKFEQFFEAKSRLECLQFFAQDPWQERWKPQCSMHNECSEYEKKLIEREMQEDKNEGGFAGIWETSVIIIINMMLQHHHKHHHLKVIPEKNAKKGKILGWTPFTRRPQSLPFVSQGLILMIIMMMITIKMIKMMIMMTKTDFSFI